MDQSRRAAADTPIYLQVVQSIQSSALYGDLNNSFFCRGGLFKWNISLTSETSLFRVSFNGIKMETSGSLRHINSDKLQLMSN
jgi:hypothetical protein